MLNDDSIPVWMLADSLLVLLTTGAIAGFAALAGDLSAPGESLMELKERLSETLHQRQELQSELNQTQAEFRSTQASLNHSQIELQRVSELLTVSQQAAENFRTETAALQTQLTGLQQQADQHQSLLDSLRQQHDTEKLLRQELLGLQGDLARAVFVIDISGSMAHEFTGDFTRANWSPGENAWTNVQRRVQDYLQLLPVTTFRIICFNHELHEFPQPGDAWTNDREAARQFLAGQNPNGLTGTEAAVFRALDLNPTSIILFTDGQPTRGANATGDDGKPAHVGYFDPDQQHRILHRIREQGAVCPINVVALNDYASETQLPIDAPAGERGLSLLKFLQEMAGRSGGAFLGF